MSKQELKQKGFTIIEVVLVLAIAALIFLMVFIAFPALQRNQRDADRKEVLGKVTSAITTYQSSKRGAQPTSGKELAGYVDGESAEGQESDVSKEEGKESADYRGTDNDTLIGNNYIVTVSSKGTGHGVASRNVIQVFTGSKCNETGDAAVAGSSRSAAVLIQLENGNDWFCQEV